MCNAGFSFYHSINYVLFFFYRFVARLLVQLIWFNSILLAIFLRIFKEHKYFVFILVSEMFS